MPAGITVMLRTFDLTVALLPVSLRVTTTSHLYE